MILLQRAETYSGVFLLAYLVGCLISILFFSLLNTPVLRLSADIVVKRMPRFSTAYFISFFCSSAFLLGGIIASRIGQPSGGSVLYGGSSVALIDSPLINLLPLIFYLVSVWLLSSKYLTDADLEFIGFNKGLAVTALQTVFMLGIGLVICVAFYV
jgi:hypothetical protein